MSTTPPYASVRSLLAGKTVLIFDFDGTIAETTPLHARAFEETFAPLGVATDYPSVAGLKTQEAIVRCLRREGRCEADFDLLALVERKAETCARADSGAARADSRGRGISRPGPIAFPHSFGHLRIARHRDPCSA